MNKSIVVLLLAGGGLALFVGGTIGVLLGALTLIAAVLFVTLRGYFPSKHAGTAVGNLVAPSVGTGFAQHAQTTTEGEVLLPYQTYKKIHGRLTGSLWTMFGLAVATLVGLRTLPVPTTVLLLPALGICIALAAYSALSLFVLVPAGQRLSTLKTLFFADPRLVFAQYAAHQPNGEVTVGYTTYKRLTRATGYVLATLLISVLVVLASEVQQARVASEANIAAANQQFQLLASHLLTGQGDLKTQVGALLAQSLQPAPTIDEKSLTQRVLSAVSKNLPPAPEPIVRETVTQQTKIVNNDFIQPHFKQAITIGAGASLAYQDDKGTTFLNIGSGPTVTIPDGGTLNIQGGWQIDGTSVTATATDLNTTSELDNTDQGNEGARYVNSRAADFTNFSPSRDDVQAALAAIDTAIGTTNTSISNTGAAAAPVSGTYVTIGNNATLTGERALAVGTGLTLTDGGANSSATLAIDSTVATLTGSQTLTNKTLTSPVISGGSIDNATIGNTTAAGGKFTTLSSTGATVLATSGGNVGIGTTVPGDKLDIGGSQNDTGKCDVLLGQNTMTIDGGGFTSRCEYALAFGGTGAGGSSSNAQMTIRANLDTNNHTLLTLYHQSQAGLTQNGNYIKLTGNSGLTPFIITGAGKTGIGTSAPGFLFDVAGTARVTQSVYLATLGGNVGIGTTAPGSKLEVNGTGFFSGNVGVGTTGTPATISSPGSGGSLSEHFGAGSLAASDGGAAFGNGASAGGVNSTAIGRNASAAGGSSVVLGTGASTGSSNGSGIAIGSSATATGVTGLAIGQSAAANDLGSIVIGRSASSTASFQLVIGGSSNGLTSGYFGSGVTAASPNNFTLNATGGSGTDITGASFTLAGGKGTGAGAGGALIFQTAAAGTTGSSLNSLSERMRIDSAGNIGIGVTNPSFRLDVTGTTRVTGQTTSTDGFVEKIIAGACVDGSFTTATNGLLCIDSSDGRLYFRYGGAWHYAAQTAGFQIPTILNPHTGKSETDGLKPGDFVMGQLNDRFDDGALHGVYIKFDFGTELLKLTTAEVKNLIADGTIVVHGDATFLGDVDVKGVLTVSKQQAGFAIIPKGGTEVEVAFDAPFSQKPVINATPHGSDGPSWWGVVLDSVSGFTIRLSEAAKSDMTFSWTAAAVNNPATSKGAAGAPVPTPSDTPTPTPTPSDTPDATPSATPVPSVSPTPSATPEPSAAPTPSPTDSPVASPSPTP